MESVPSCIMRWKDGICMNIGAKPNSKESKIIGIDEECIVVSISAPAKEGEANQELIRFLAEVLGVKRNTLSLNKGAKSKQKVVYLDQVVSIEMIYEKLLKAITQQQ